MDDLSRFKFAARAAMKAIIIATPPRRGVLLSWIFLSSGRSTIFSFSAIVLITGVKLADRDIAKRRM